METKISYYYEKNNFLFKKNVLVICYNADKKEIEEYKLTSNNIVLFICCDEINNIILAKKCDYRKVIADVMRKKIIFLRIQSECFLGMYGDSHCDCENQRIEAIKVIAEKGGILIHLPQEAQGWGLFYKLKELELQVSGKMPDGEYIGIQTRDDAQKKLLNKECFDDMRNYNLVYKILNYFNLTENNYVLISESEKKVNNLKKLGLSVEKYQDYIKTEINSENASEYLVKILDNSHKFNDETIDKVLTVINERKYNDRTLSTMLDIVHKINNDKEYKIDKDLKNKIIETYEHIICGEEKKYIIDNEKNFKIQNNFSCKVDSSIFKALTDIYGYNIFDRISLEKLHYFQNKKNNETIRIRTSQILDIVETKCKMFKGQKHSELTIVNDNKNKILQQEVTNSKLRSFFENPEYEYIKRVEMITIISENVIPNINIYIKRLPKIENRCMDVFGKSEKIKEFINLISKQNSKSLLNLITDIKLENQNFSEYNLRFSDINGVIEEEISMYELTKGVENNGI